MKIYIYQHVKDSGEPEMWPCTHHMSEAEQVKRRIVLVGECELECTPLSNEEAEARYRTMWQKAVDEQHELVRKKYGDQAA